MEIPGLQLYKDVITSEHEQDIILTLDKQTWSDSLSRRTQQYGYEYNYTSRNVNKQVEPFLPELQNIVNWIDTHITKGSINLDQCIVNEYYRDQCIGKHIDSPTAFGDTIISLSLGESTNFSFTHKETQKVVELELPVRSLLILTGEARYDWQHAIPKRKTYTIDGRKVNKSDDYRRISLTFRSIKK
jgi:alkylated DNA repair protein alkB family protein 8